jgi:hypothetical protein
MRSRFERFATRNETLAVCLCKRSSAHTQPSKGTPHLWRMFPWVECARERRVLAQSVWVTPKSLT